MRDVILLAASGLAREVIAASTPTHRVVGILDDDQRLHGTGVDGVEVLGSIGDAGNYNTNFLVCIGAGSTRRDVVDRLAGLAITEARFPPFIDSGARVPHGSVIGPGSILLAGVVLTAGVRVGRHAVVMPQVTLTHDVVLGDFVTVAAGVSLGGGVVIGDAAYLGMNASIRQRVHVGHGATVGMGAVVLSDIPSEQTWAGVPAAPLARTS